MMATLSLCLEMLFRDLPFAERMRAAARLGYRAIEFWDWRDKDLEQIGRESARLGLRIAAISGNRRHALIDPSARAGLIDEMEGVFGVAERLGCGNIMLLSDVLETDGSAAPMPPLTAEAKLDSIVDSLGVLADRLGNRAITLLLEPLNSVLDHRRCFLTDSTRGAEIVRRVARPQVKLLYDVYHMSMMDENAAAEIGRKAEWIGYVHVADMPGRHEPGTGTIDYGAVWKALRGSGYQGFVGMEFSAQGSEEAAARRPLEVFAI